ncbi:hypothetical protein ID866_8320 [Astraeus odoratus]|nr:hypothetical protein ID866_8320 [Astraeus odoratus]
MPTPRAAGPSLDEQLLDLLGVPPTQRPTGVQAPPPLIPFTYQPAPRPSRSRSTSPVLRTATAPPFPDTTFFSPETIHPPLGPLRPQPRPHPARAARPVDLRPRPHESPPPSVQLPPSRPPQREHPAATADRPVLPPVRPVLPRLYDDVPGRPPTAPAHLGGVDDPHASRSWYQPPRPDGQAGVVPPVGTVFPAAQPTAQGPTYVPMPPGPTVVQVPLFDTLMEILREHRLAQLATVDQQRELMRYMRGLNDWLARDVNDRQAELRGVTARIDQLRAELGRHGLGAGVIPPPMPQPHVDVHVPPGPAQPAPVVIPPLPAHAAPGPIPPPPVVTVNYPPNVMQPVGFDGVPVMPVPGVPVIPSPRSPIRPFVPSPPPDWRMGMPEPPVIPHGAPFVGQPHPPVAHPPHVEPDVVVPSTPSDVSPAGQPPLVVRPPRPPTQFVVDSSPRSTTSATPTQESFHRAPSPRPVPIPVGEPVVPIPMSRPTTPAYSPGQVVVAPAPVPMGPSPVMPPPGIVHSPEPVIAHTAPPVVPPVGTVPVPGSPRMGMLAPTMPISPGQPIVVQPPPQVPQVVMQSPPRSPHRSPHRSPSPMMMPPSHGPTFPEAPPIPPTAAPGGVVMQGSPTIHAYPDHQVVSVPMYGRTYTDSDDYYYRRRRPSYYDYDYYPRRYRSPYYDDDDYYSRRRRPSRRRRRRDPDEESYESESDDRHGRRLHRPQPTTTEGDPSQVPTDPALREGPARPGIQPEAAPPGRLPADEHDGGRREPEGGQPPTTHAAEEGEHPPRRTQVSPETPVGRDDSRRRRPSDQSAYSSEFHEYGPGRRRPSPSVLHTPRPDYGDVGAGVPHGYPPHSPSQPTIIRLGGEMDHVQPPHHVVIAPSAGSPRRYPSPRRSVSPHTRYAQELMNVPDGGTAIPYLPGEGGGRPPPRHPTSYPGSAEGDPHDRRRTPSRRTPSHGAPPPPTDISEGDNGRPPSEIAHRVPAPAAPEHVLPGPEHIQFPDDLRDQHERLGEAERELAQIIHDAHDAELKREDDFRTSEEARQQIFEENEAQRDAASRQRSDALFHELEERVANAPPLPVPPPRDHDQDQVSIIESIRTATQDAASRHAADILETVRGERELLDKEREQLAAERERERAGLAAERLRIDEEHAARVQALEEELDRVRAELDNERQLRMTEADETRAAAAERDEALRNQLADIANMVQQNHSCCEENKAMTEAHWAEKQNWKNERDNQIQELLGIVARVVEEQAAARQREEEARQANEGKPSIEEVLEQLRNQNNDQRDLLNALSDSWRADNQRQHDELVNTVRATANEQVPYNVQGYLDEFSKALASEVRMLLGEVGKLREERRTIQHELGFLMMMRAKYSPGGEFVDPEWRPTMPAGPDMPPPPPPPPDVPPPPDEPPHVRPGWRPVPQRSTRRIRKRGPEPPPAPEPVPEPRITHSWATWHPNPALAPTPPSIEPTLVVPDRQSPGLFGPRSPRGSFR